MIEIVIVIVVLFGIIALFKQKSGVSSSTPTAPKEAPLPYRKKQYFLTRAENNVLKQLEKLIDGKYFIFPQVHYSKIIYADGQQNFRNPWFNKIDRKSADFVLFDKENVSPVLVIEHDDATHRRTDRMERDEFIEKALIRCGIPLLRVKPYTGDEELIKQLREKVQI